MYVEMTLWFRQSLLQKECTRQIIGIFEIIKIEDKTILKKKAFDTKTKQMPKVLKYLFHSLATFKDKWLN